MAKSPTRTSSVLGPDGAPVKVPVLTQDHAAPTTTGIRTPWADGVSSGLDPSKLANMLKAADEGDNVEFLTLAEEMEERDAHYASVLGQRKRALSGISPLVTPASKDAKDVEIAKEVEDLVAKPIFADLIDDLLDGIAKGYSVVETEWNFAKQPWLPKAYKYRDPRHFMFDRETGQEIRIREDGLPDGKSIDPYSMIIHRPKLKTGLTVRGGVARIAAWCFMLKSFTLQDWAAFLEVFGMPLRVGRYDNNASAEEKRILLRAVRDLGSDAAAIIPKGMEIEFIQAAGGQGNAVFSAMAAYLDKQMSKAIIGQTMTTDEGSSRSQSETHDEVRGDITKSDARQLATTINRDLIAPFVAFNHGPDAALPIVSFPVEDAEDVKALSEALGIVVPLGFKVSQADVAKRLRFPVPDKDEDILVPPQPAASAPPAPANLAHFRNHATRCPGCGETHLARAEDDPDPLVTEAMDEWEADMAPTVTKILAAAKSADSYETFLASLDGVTPDVVAMTDRLAIQMMKARGDGVTDG